MARDVEVKVKVNTQEAERKLATFRERQSEAGARARGARGQGLSVGGRARLNRAQGLDFAGGGRTAKTLAGIARQGALILAAIAIVVTLAKAAIAAIEAVALGIDSLGFTNLGEAIQKITGEINDQFGKIRAQLDRTRAITDVAKPLASAGITIGAGDLATISERFVESGARKFRESQRQSSRDFRDYGRIILGLGG